MAEEASVTLNGWQATALRSVLGELLGEATDCVSITLVGVVYQVVEVPSMRKATIDPVGNVEFRDSF